MRRTFPCDFRAVGEQTACVFLHLLRQVLAVSVMFLLAACGGGGGGNQAVFFPVVPANPEAPAVITATVTIDPAEQPSLINAVIGIEREVHITFRMPEGETATRFNITSGLYPLPPKNWVGKVSSFDCPEVGSGDSCTLSLTFIAWAATGQTKLTLAYHYFDAYGGARDGRVEIPYSVVEANDVLITAYPGDAVQARVGETHTVDLIFTATEG